MKWRPDRSFFFFFFLVVFASVSMKNCWILYWMYLWNFVKRWTMADTSQNIDRNLFLQNYKIAHWPLWMTRPRKCRSNFCISSLFCSCRSALCYYQSHPHKLFNLCPLARACCVVLQLHDSQGQSTWSWLISSCIPFLHLSSTMLFVWLVLGLSF